MGLEGFFEKLVAIVFLVAFAAVMSLPGLLVTFLGWKISRKLRPLFFQAACRAGILAVALTPSFYGHAEVAPAIVLACVLHGRDKLVGIIPILIVWTVAIPVLFFRARNRDSRLA